jgi:hypothetical protein
MADLLRLSADVKYMFPKHAWYADILPVPWAYVCSTKLCMRRVLSHIVKPSGSCSTARVERLDGLTFLRE